MTNTSVYFFPKRRLITPAPPTDTLYQIDLTLSAFDMTTEINSQESSTLAGFYSRSLYSEVDNYSCTVADSTATTDEMRMFISSVIAGEQFYMTNLDESDRLMTVQLKGRPSRSRASAADVGQFRYQFTVMEIPQI